MKKRRPGFYTADGPARGADHPSAKLTPQDVLAIRRSKLGCTQLARQFGVGRETIRLIKARRIWAWLTNDGQVSKRAAL